MRVEVFGARRQKEPAKRLGDSSARLETARTPANSVSLCDGSCGCDTGPKNIETFGAAYQHDPAVARALPAGCWLAILANAQARRGRTGAPGAGTRPNGYRRFPAAPHRPAMEKHHHLAHHTGSAAACFPSM